MKIRECTVNWLSDTDIDTDLGVIRRLLAAITSATERGGVRVGLKETDRRSTPNSFEDWRDDQIVTFDVTISSGEGIWGKRPYHFQGTVELSRDAFGVTRVHASAATAVVLTGDRSEGTRFTGGGVDYALSRLFRLVALRDLALIGLGLCEAPPEPHALEEWAEGEDLVLEFTGEAEVMPTPLPSTRGERPSRPNRTSRS